MLSFTLLFYLFPVRKSVCPFSKCYFSDTEETISEMLWNVPSSERCRLHTQLFRDLQEQALME